MVFQKTQLLFPGLLYVAPFFLPGEHREEEVQMELLKILGDQTELPYLMGNVRKHPRQP